jgi:glycosyltransferase involved in cell wall biosynthesis
LAQRFDRHVVLVSDNSRDDSVERFMSTVDDPRVTYVKGPGTGPLANAVSLLRRATTPYVAFLHDDDAWEPDLLSELIPPLEADPTLGVSFGDFSVMGPDGEVLADETEWSTRHARRDRLAAGPVGSLMEVALIDQAIPAEWSAVFRRDALDLDDFPEEVDQVDDLWLCYQVCAGGHGAYFVPERLARVRFHDRRLTVGDRFTDAFVFVYGRVESDPRCAPVHDAVRRRVVQFRTSAAVDRIAEGRIDEARALLARTTGTGFDARRVVATSLAYAPTPVRRLGAWTIRSTRERGLRLPPRSGR